MLKRGSVTEKGVWCMYLRTVSHEPATENAAQRLPMSASTTTGVRVSLPGAPSPAAVRAAWTAFQYENPKKTANEMIQSMRDVVRIVRKTVS